LEFLLICIIYTETVDQAIFLFNTALKEIKKFDFYIEWTTDMTAWLYNNLSIRLLRMTPCEVIEYPDLFKKTIENSLNFFEKHNFQLHMSIALIRKGIYFMDIPFIYKGLNKLKEAGEDEAYKIMLQVVLDCSKKF